VIMRLRCGRGRLSRCCQPVVRAGGGVLKRGGPNIHAESALGVPGLALPDPQGRDEGYFLCVEYTIVKIVYIICVIGSLV
jgi:hypothetical protein